MISVTRLGEFLKFWTTNFIIKVAQKLATFWAIAEKIAFVAKTAVGPFWPTFGKIGLLFIPTSGHTEFD